MNSKKRATISDVARAAGLSVGTVSNVVNGRRVSDVNYLKVKNAMDKLGYVVNESAQALRKDKTSTIALIIPNINSPYFSELVQHINEFSSQEGLNTIIACSDYDINEESKMINMAKDKRVAGIIALTYNPWLEIPEGLNFISLDRIVSPETFCVTSANYDGGALAAEKLVNLGSKKLAVVMVEALADNEPKKRVNGFVDYCEANDIQYKKNIISEEMNDEEEIVKFLTKEFIHKKSGIDGIFCGTDKLAYRTIKHLREINIRVPEDVQVIGFDGTRMFGTDDYICSSIGQDVQAIARKAVEIIILEDKSKLDLKFEIPISYIKGPSTRDFYS